MLSPVFEALLGAPPDNVRPLLDYGYRGAWKVRACGESFIVKADTRGAFLQNEVTAQRHAEAAGVPVPDIIAAAADPIPALAMRWVEGVALHARPSPAAWRDAGRVLRLAHGASVLRRRDERWGDFVHDWFARELPYLVEHHGLVAEDADVALRHAGELRASLNRRPLAWLHGDCQAAHFLIDPTTERVTAVLDWADAQEGDPAIDLAVLTLFDDGVLGHVLDGYEAAPEFREHVMRTLPLYRAVRGAGAARWLDDHHIPGGDWPTAAVRSLVRHGR